MAWKRKNWGGYSQEAEYDWYDDSHSTRHQPPREGGGSEASAKYENWRTRSVAFARRRVGSAAAAAAVVVAVAARGFMDEGMATAAAAGWGNGGGRVHRHQRKICRRRRRRGLSRR